VFGGEPASAAGGVATEELGFTAEEVVVDTDLPADAGAVTEGAGSSDALMSERGIGFGAGTAELAIGVDARAIGAGTAEFGTTNEGIGDVEIGFEGISKVGIGNEGMEEIVMDEFFPPTS